LHVFKAAHVDRLCGARAHSDEVQVWDGARVTGKPRRITIGARVSACALVLSLVTAALPAFAAAPEGPDAMRRVLDAGAMELALERITVLQPKDPSAPTWSHWEGLRCEALARLDRHTALLARADALPPKATGPELNVCLIEAARAALAQQQPESARLRLARLLWERKTTRDEARDARLLVIESYIAESRGADAFHSMLRFQQDFQPLDRALVDRFAHALIDVKLHSEALHWLGQRSEPSAARLRLQLRAGTITPQAAVSEARAALARATDAAYWRVIADAGAAQRNAAIEIEGLERLLHIAHRRDVRSAAELAERLWKTYSANAVEIANRQQLLVGDEGTWADYASRRLGSEPQVARAIYGHLAQRGPDPGLRRNAQLQLVFSLQSAGLERAALRLFGDGAIAFDALDAQVRYLLGSAAEVHGEPALALKLWSGIAPPPKLTADEWPLRVAQAAIRAGHPDAAVAALKQLTAGRKTLGPELVQRSIDLAQELLDLRRLEAAQAMYELVLPYAPEPRAREALFGLGRVHEFRNDHVAAAAFYLRSATLTNAPATDGLALQSRLLAGLSLARAGYRNDARAQLDWVIRHSKDAQFTETARRELKKL
jgi:hypothetical protein